MKTVLYQITALKILPFTEYITYNIFNISCWGNRREGDNWGDLRVDG